MPGGCLCSIPAPASTERGDRRGGEEERNVLTVSLISQRKTEPALRQQPSLKETRSARKKKKRIKKLLTLCIWCLPPRPRAQKLSWWKAQWGCADLQLLTVRDSRQGHVHPHPGWLRDQIRYSALSHAPMAATSPRQVPSPQGRQGCSHRSSAPRFPGTSSAHAAASVAARLPRRTGAGALLVQSARPRDRAPASARGAPCTQPQPGLHAWCWLQACNPKPRLLSGSHARTAFVLLVFCGHQGVPLQLLSVLLVLLIPGSHCNYENLIKTVSMKNRASWPMQFPTLFFKKKKRGKKKKRHSQQARTYPAVYTVPV